MEIRHLKRSDFSKTAKVYSDAFCTADENWTPDTAKKLLKLLIKYQPDLFFIAKDKKKIVGGIWGLIKYWEDGYFISEVELFVSPEYHGKGLSVFLLKRIIEEGIKRYNIKGIDAIANSKREFPFSYYRNLGFKETGYVHISGNAEEILIKLSEKAKKHIL